MKQYIESLEKLKNYEIEKIAPGHGEVLETHTKLLIGLSIIDLRKKVFEALKEVTRGTLYLAGFMMMSTLLYFQL